MILAPHMLIGAAIGSRFKNYWIIFVLAFGTHFLFDALPHWEYQANLADMTASALLIFLIKPLLDIAAGALIIWLLLRSSKFLWPALFGAFCAILPDGLNFLFFALQIYPGWKIQPLYDFFLFHQSLHLPKNKNPQDWGALLEGLISIVSIYVIGLNFTARAPRKNHSKIPK